MVRQTHARGTVPNPRIKPLPQAEGRSRLQEAPFPFLSPFFSPVPAAFSQLPLNAGIFPGSLWPFLDIHWHFLMRHGYPIRLSLSINALSLLSGRAFSFLPSKNSGFTLSGEQYPLSFCGKRGLPSLCFHRKHALAVRTGTSYLKEFLMKRWFKMLTGSLAVVLFITFSCAAFAAAPRPRAIAPS